MKKVFAIMMVLVIAFVTTGCNIFTERAYSYDIDEFGNKTLTDVYEYDDDGNLLWHAEVVENNVDG